MSIELELLGVRAGYGPVEVLHGVDLAVPAGRVTGLVGPNGAGKTTLLRLVAGLLPLKDGSLRWRGEDVSRLPADERARRGLVAVPEGGGVFPGLSVRDNLAIFAQGGPIDAAVATFPVLEERLRQRASTLSGGEQRMLALSPALLRSPSLLLVDEPSLGLAPALTDRLYEVIAQVAERGVTVLLADQYVDRVTDLAAVVYRLEHGEVAFAGEPAELAGG